ncbi:MAG: L-threonine 3-dehydrogenase [Deltaproteobacteria bacterium]|nr:L-threonine 3-dehydrogenase [Deltaproteobacteria bacterium]
MEKILVTGSLGQIGSELVVELRKRYGNDNVVATDIRRSIRDGSDVGPYEYLDCLDPHQIVSIVKKYNIDTVYHLAALLSAVAESKPQDAWNVNVTGLYNVLETARIFGLSVFTPSSIGAFGPATPSVNTPQDTLQRPTSMYGVTKVAGELLCDYYFKRFGVDTRGVRYPGIISNVTPPGGGTTDYAVHIYYEALSSGKYTSFLSARTRLDMMYMPDAIEAAIGVMEADSSKLLHRNAFNVTAMSVSPEDIAAEIRKSIPEFTLSYDIDPIRQSIADSWPDSMDDRSAREEWGWNPVYDLSSMTLDMLEKLSERITKK